MSWPARESLKETRRSHPVDIAAILENVATMDAARRFVQALPLPKRVGAFEHLSEPVVGCASEAACDDQRKKEDEEMG